MRNTDNNVHTRTLHTHGVILIYSIYSIRQHRYHHSSSSSRHLFTEAEFVENVQSTPTTRCSYTRAYGFLTLPYLQSHNSMRLKAFNSEGNELTAYKTRSYAEPHGAVGLPHSTDRTERAKDADGTRSCRSPEAHGRRRCVVTAAKPINCPAAQKTRDVRVIYRLLGWWTAGWRSGGQHGVRSGNRWRMYRTGERLRRCDNGAELMEVAWHRWRSQWKLVVETMSAAAYRGQYIYIYIYIYQNIASEQHAD